MLGNGAYSSIGHVPVNDQVSLLFIDFANGGRLHVNGRATEHDEAERVATFPGDENRWSPKRVEDQNRPPVLAELVLAYLTGRFPTDVVSAHQRSN